MERAPIAERMWAVKALRVGYQAGLPVRAASGERRVKAKDRASSPADGW